MKTRAYLCIIVGASLWGFIGLFVKTLAAQGFTALQIVTLRMLTAAICITPVVYNQGKEYFKIELKDVWMFLGTGVVSVTFFTFCYFQCIQASSLATAALLLYTAPAFVMLISLVLFKESFTLTKGVALLAAFVGCGLVTGAFSGEMNLSFKGILLGLGSGIGYALYSIFGKFALQKYSTWTVTAYTFYFSFLSSFMVADFAHCTAAWSWSTLGGALGVGFVCAAFPYLLYTKGLEHVEAGQASILATVEPVVASLVGIIVFAEPVTIEKIAGIVLVVGSVMALNLPKKSKA